MTRSNSIDAYTIKAELGRGGMGVVQLGHHPVFGQVALKRLHREATPFAQQSLRSEVRWLSRLRHRGVVRMLDHGEDRWGPWMAMQLVAGQPLSAYLHSFRHTASHSTKAHWTQRLTAELTATHEPTATNQQLATTAIHKPAATNQQPAITATHEPTTASQETAQPLGHHTSWALSATQTVGSVEPTGHDPRSPTTSSTQSVRVTSAVPVAASRTAMLRWLYQVCQALSYIHSQGIVHADLKPSNILVNRSDQAPDEVVLVDFGLATPFGSRVEVEAIERAGLLAGSLLYISPEQCRGEPLDARADLYALGCILFEILAGRPPFLSGDGGSLALLDMHVHHTPPDLAELGVEVPERWQHLVETMWGLLAKPPLQRPGYAHVLLRALEDAGIATDLRQPSLEGRATLHRPVFLGRASLFEQLFDTLTQVSQAAQGQRVLLGGESGVGKSTLVQELSRAARRVGVRVVVGYSSHTLRAGHQEERPLGLFVPILRAVADRWNQDRTLQKELLSPTDVALLAPFAPFIAQLPGLEEATTVHLPALPVDMAQLRLLVCLMGVLERFCAGQPTLFAFEDLHWADELSLAALEFMCREFVEGLPWMVVGTYRSEECTDDLQMFIDESPCQVMKVERLDNQAVTELVGQMLGDDFDGVLAQELATRAGGNPFFAAEYLRAMVDSGTLQLDSDGRWAMATSDLEAPWPEPESIQALLARRLGKLRRDEQRLCEVAAVVGRRMHSDLLRQLSGMTRFAFNNALDELIQLHILEPDPETQDDRELRFVHDKLRETAYAQTPPDRLVHLHNTTAQTLEALGDGVDSATVALHWAKGGDPKRAREGYIEAARQDAERWAVRNARRHIEAALALEPAEADTKDMALRMELIRLSQLLGEHAEAMAYAEQALALLGADQAESSHARDALLLHLDMASSLGHQTRFDEAEAHLDQAESLIKSLEHDDYLEGRLALVKGTLSADFEDHAATTAALFERAAHHLAKSGDTALQAQSLVGLSGALLALSRPDEAMERCRDAQRFYQQNRDLHGEALLWERMGQIRVHQAPEEALVLVRNALEAHQTTGNGVGEARTLSLMGHVLGQQGRYSEGLQCLMQAKRLQERYGISRWKAMASMAILYVYLGQVQQGADWIMEAQRQAEQELGEHPSTLIGRRCYIMLALGDPKQIREALDAFRVYVDPDNPYAHPNISLLNYEAQLCIAEERWAEADRLLERYQEAMAAHGRPMYVDYTLVGRANIHILLGLLDEAQTMLDTVSEHLLATLPDLAAAHAMATSRLRRHQGAPQEAKPHAERALAHYKDAQSADKTAAAQAEMGLIAHALGEEVEPWLRAFERTAQELDVYPYTNVGRSFRALEAIAPGRVTVRFRGEPQP